MLLQQLFFLKKDHMLYSYDHIDLNILDILYDMGNILMLIHYRKFQVYKYINFLLDLGLLYYMLSIQYLYYQNMFSMNNGKLNKALQKKLLHIRNCKDNYFLKLFSDSVDRKKYSCY